MPFNNNGYPGSIAPTLDYNQQQQNQSRMSTYSSFNSIPNFNQIQPQQFQSPPQQQQRSSYYANPASVPLPPATIGSRRDSSMSIYTTGYGGIQSQASPSVYSSASPFVQSSLLPTTPSVNLSVNPTDEEIVQALK